MDKDGAWDTATAQQQAVSIEPPMGSIRPFRASCAPPFPPRTVNDSFSVVTSLGVSACASSTLWRRDLAKQTVKRRHEHDRN
jgi:hypothetical protein